MKKPKADTGLPPIVSEETARRIVHFVAKEKEDVPLEEIEAVPPILSLLCRELNERRFTEHAGTAEKPAAQITFREGETDIETIIATFYERCLKGRPEAVRILIEEELVSSTAARASSRTSEASSKSSPMAARSLAPPMIGALRVIGDSAQPVPAWKNWSTSACSPRLGGGEKPSYELIHDLLAAVVEKSRTAREKTSKQSRPGYASRRREKPKRRPKRAAGRTRCALRRPPLCSQRIDVALEKRNPSSQGRRPRHPPRPLACGRGNPGRTDAFAAFVGRLEAEKRAVASKKLPMS